MQEKDHSIKTVQSKGAAVSHSSGGKIPYVNGSISVLMDIRMANLAIDTPSMYGRPREDGTRSQRTGKQIRR